MSLCKKEDYAHTPKPIKKTEKEQCPMLKSGIVVLAIYTDCTAGQAALRQHLRYTLIIPKNYPKSRSFYCYIGKNFVLS